MSHRIPTRRASRIYCAETLESRVMFLVQGAQTVPINVVSGQDIALTGTQNVAELLKLVPKSCDAQVVVRGDGLTQTQKGNEFIVNGTNFSIDSINLTNTSDRSGLLFTGARGFTLPVTDITTTGVVNYIMAKPVDVTGTVSLGGARSLNFLSLSGAHLTVGGGLPMQSFQSGTMTNSRLNFGSSLSLFQSGPIVSSHGSSSVTGTSIGRFLVKGDADTNLNLTANLRRNLDLGMVTGQVSGGNWNIGAAGNVTAGSFGSDFQGNFNSLNSILSRGAFNGSLQSPFISQARFGSTDGASIFLTRPLSTSSLPNINTLKVTGGFSNSFIRSDGNLGNLTFGSFNGSSAFAGVDPNADTFTLPTIPQLLSNATIRNFNLTGRSASFSNSYLAAFRIGPTNLGTIIPQSSDGNPFGITTYKLDKLHFELTRPFTATNIDRAQDILNAEQRAHILPTQLGNFTVRLSM
jgi:hypothetical protein